MCDLLFPLTLFVFLGAYLLRLDEKHSSKLSYELGQLFNAFSRSAMNLSNEKFLSLYVNLIGSAFLIEDLSIVYIMWWWSLNPVSKVLVFLKEYFRLVKIKSMQVPLPLKHVFTLIKLYKALFLCFKSPVEGSKLRSPIITWLS